MEAPDPTGGGQEQEMVGGDQQVIRSLLQEELVLFANLDEAILMVLILDVNIRDFNHVGRRWSSSLSRSQKRPKWREVKKVCSGSASSSRSDL